MAQIWDGLAYYEDFLYTIRAMDPDLNAVISENLDRLDLSGRRVLLVVPDSTRTAPVGEAFRSVYRAVRRQNGTLDAMVALGTHPPMNQKALLGHFGLSPEEKRSRYADVRIFNHEWDNPKALVQIGTLERGWIRETSGGLLDEGLPVRINRRIFDYDQLLILSPVFPHEVVGFSGGTKYFFPGISGPEIIDLTHWLGALLTNRQVIGRIDTPVRRIIDEAARLITVPYRIIALVVGHETASRPGPDHGLGLGQPDSVACFVGTMHDAWRQAAALSSRRHIIWKARKYCSVLACAPRMYDDLWTGAKCMYKCEDIVEDGGELIIYAPHITSFSVTHGRLLERVGYHVSEYFTSNLDRFRDLPRAVLAVSTYVKGAGTCRNGLESPRIRVALATGIPRQRCERAGLLYRNPTSIAIERWRNAEDQGRLLVEQAGQTLYRFGADDP